MFRTCGRGQFAPSIGLMRSLRQLLESPTLAPLLGYLVRPELDPVVERVALIEEPGEVGHVGEHAIVLLTRAGSVTASTYRFDIALRVARTRRIAALVLCAVDAENLTPTSAAIANRSGTAILGTFTFKSTTTAPFDQLTLGDVQQLAKGRTAAHRKLREQIDELLK